MKIRNSHGKTSLELTDKMAPQEQDVFYKYDLIEKDKTLAIVEDSLKELNEEQQQCVTLFYLKKKSYQQVSDMTGYNLLQVKSFIQNGKRNLKQIVEKKMKLSNG